MQAIGAAGALGVASALIRQTYPSTQLGRGLGINSVIVASSAAAAPTVGGLILGIAAWPWVFAAAIPFALVSLLLGRALPEARPGVLCVYLAQRQQNVLDLDFLTAGRSIGADRFGTIVHVEADAAGPVSVHGSWAVTGT